MGIVGHTLMGRYQIIDERDKGGMSTVYLARDVNLGCYWAIKRVRNLSNLEMEAFKSEVELLSSLAHSDIPRIVDKFEIDDGYYVVMDFINGVSLGKKVLSDGPVPEKTVVEWSKNLCDILNYLHNIGPNPIVFRDMKPDNVMLMDTGRVKLIDFGIAKECVRGQAQTGANVGTKGFSAPEQYKGSSNILDERTDVYSLGATMFYLLTAVMPGLPPNAIPPLRSVNAKLSEGMEYIIAKSTRDDPAERYGNCRELLEDLNNVEFMSTRYRNKAVKRFASFMSLTLASVFFAVSSFTGWQGTIRDQNEQYRAYLQAADASYKDHRYAEAAELYGKAVDQARTFNTEVYRSLLRAMCMSEPDNIPRAIKDFKDQYIDSKTSAGHDNELLKYMVASNCIEYGGSNDASMHRLALDYLQEIKNSRTYAQDKQFKAEVDAKLAFAYYLVDPRSEDVKSALATLSAIAAEQPDSDQKLNNYHILIMVYSRHTQDDAYYNDVVAAADEAKRIIDKGSAREFPYTVKLFELAAVYCETEGLSSTDVAVKRSRLQKSIEYYELLINKAPSTQASLSLCRVKLVLVNTYHDKASFQSVSEWLTRELDEVSSVCGETAAGEDGVSLDSKNILFWSQLLKTQAALYAERFASPVRYTRTVECFRTTKSMYAQYRSSLKNEMLAFYEQLTQELDAYGVR